MANVVNKIFVDRMGGRKAAKYIGQKGDLFYDQEAASNIRISDGVTPGGKPFGGDSVLGSYRHFQAGCNVFHNTDDQDIAQIFIHNAVGKVDYINFTADTNNDDFYVTGLKHQSAETDSSWYADKIIVLNVYGNYGDLSVSDLRTFVRKFIDTVLYTAEDNAVTDIQQAKELFYDNIDVLTASLPAGALFENFAFDDYRRVHWPEYNGPNGNATANIKVWIDPTDGILNASPSYDDVGRLLILCSGTGYSVGDKIVLEGQQLGGVNGANDLTITVTDLKSGNITGLQMTSGGDSFYPQMGSASNYDSLQNGTGGGAGIRITSCTENGTIVDWQILNDGAGYEVGDTLTLNYGGADATFEVISVGTDGIDGWQLSGNAYVGSPAKVPYGYWPNMSIGDGGGDQYDDSNWISTDRSSWSIIADFTNNKMIMNGGYHSGDIPLQPGMLGTMRNPEDVNDFYTFTLVSQATDNSNVWYINGGINGSAYQVRIDGIPYNGGQPQAENGAFGDQYVTVYDQSIFAMIAFNASNVNSVYYNGEMGADGSGTKSVEVLLGVDGGAQESLGIPQRMINDNEYTIVPTDNGKHIYCPAGDNTIYIPPETTANFPVGTAITFISSSNNPTWISCWDTNATQVWGAGFNTTSPWWAIPSNSMGTMLKVGPEKWIVSGAGLYNDD